MWDGIYLEWFIKWFSFVIVMALGQFSPGPDMILLTRVALADGLKSGCATAAGIATGLMIHAGIAIFFVGILATQPPMLKLCIYLLAGIYLLWLAYGLLTSAFIGYYSGQILEFGSKKSHQFRSLKSHYRRGFFCNLCNPKVAIFLAGVVLPFQQLAPESTAWSITLWLTIIMEGLLLWCLWVKLLQSRQIKHWYSRCAHLIDGFFGLALVILAIFILKEVLNF